LASVRSKLSEPGRQQNFRLFSVVRHPVHGQLEWLLLLALLVYVAYSTFRGLRLGWSATELWSMAIVAALLSVSACMPTNSRTR